MTRKDHCIKCGERDPAALTQTTLCREHLAEARGISPIEKHHPVGRAIANETISLPANIHAVLTAKMTDWPEMLRKPSLDPIIQIVRREFAKQNFLEWYVRASRRDAKWLLAFAIDHVEQHGAEWWRDLGIAPLQPSNSERSGNE